MNKQKRALQAGCSGILLGLLALLSVVWGMAADRGPEPMAETVALWPFHEAPAEAPKKGPSDADRSKAFCEKKVRRAKESGISEQYEFYLKASYDYTRGALRHAYETARDLSELSPPPIARDIEVKLLFDAGRFSDLVSLSLFKDPTPAELQDNWELMLLGARAYDMLDRDREAGELFDALDKEHGTKEPKEQLVYFDALRLIKRGKKAEALKRIDKFLSVTNQKARHAIFYQLKAAIYLQPPESDLHKALAMITKSVEINPRSEKGWRTKAALHERLGQGDEALAAVRSLLELTDDPIARKALVERLFKQKQYAEAAKELQKLPEETAEHYFDLGLISWKGGDAVAGYANLDKALALDPKFVRARLLRLEMLLSENRRSDLLDTLISWIDVDAENELALRTFLMLTQYGFTVDELAKRLDPLLDTHPHDLKLICAAADLQLLEKRYEKALKLYEKATSRVNGDEALLARLDYQIGYLQSKMGKSDQAILSLRKAVRHDRTFAAAYNLLAYLHAEAGTKLDEALSLVEKALALSPANPSYLDTKNLILLKKGNGVPVPGVPKRKS